MCSTLDFNSALSPRVPSNPTAVPWAKTVQSGVNLIRNAVYNKGLAFSKEERTDLRLIGLLPNELNTIAMQGNRILWSVARKDDDLEKFDYLMTVLDQNTHLFYYVVSHNIKQFLPILWTPTVGRACQQYSSSYFMSRPRSLWVTSLDMRNIQNIVNNWPEDNVKVVVLTDGAGVLGLGDLGAHSAPIPISKSILYTVLGSLNPKSILPVVIDVGTNNESLLDSDGYLGLQQNRDNEEIYDALLEEFLRAITRRYGSSTIFDFEDFGGKNALRLLNKFQDRYCVYNDDIQSTAAVVLGIVFGSLRISKLSLTDHVFLIYGAGMAGIGIASLISLALQREGLSEADAKSKIFMVDSKGLIVTSRKKLTPEKQQFAQDVHGVTDLEQIVRSVKATCLVGVSSQPMAFTRGVCGGMAKNTERPLIIPLSNPREKAECIAHDAFTWTNRKCLFASGSPSSALEVGTEIITPTQGTNAYINGGLALGAVAVGAHTIPQDLFLAAAKAIGMSASDEHLETGAVLPPIEHLRQVAINVACEVAAKSFELGIASVVEPKEVRELVLATCWHHHRYPQLVENGPRSSDSQKLHVEVKSGSNFKPVSEHFRPSCHGKADLYCLLTSYDTDGRTLDIKRTTIQKASLEPVWEVKFDKWDAVDETHRIGVEIFDYDWWKFSDDFVGHFEISRDEMNGELREFSVTASEKGEFKNDGAKILISANIV